MSLEISLYFLALFYVYLYFFLLSFSFLGFSFHFSFSFLFYLLGVPPFTLFIFLYVLRWFSSVSFSFVIHFQAIVYLLKRTSASAVGGRVIGALSADDLGAFTGQETSGVQPRAPFSATPEIS